MRAKFVNEEKMVNEPDTKNMAFEIAQVVNSTYEGDDVDYEPTEEDIEQLESIIKENVKRGHLYLDDDENFQESFGDETWILGNVPPNEISDVYMGLVDAGFIDSGDFPNEDNDTFDLDQDIYDRNPDWDVDESVDPEKSGPMLDYSEAQWKMDKYMPDDPDLQDEYYEILDSGDVDALEEFLELNADEEILYRYMPKGGTIRGLANYMIGNE